MIETQGPALEAESKYRKERATDAFAVRRAAYERRAERAARGQAPAAGRSHGLAAVLRGWRSPRSNAWRAAH